VPLAPLALGSYECAYGVWAARGRLAIRGRLAGGYLQGVVLEEVSDGMSDGMEEGGEASGVPDEAALGSWQRTRLGFYGASRKADLRCRYCGRVY